MGNSDSIGFAIFAFVIREAESTSLSISQWLAASFLSGMAGTIVSLATVAYGYGLISGRLKADSVRGAMLSVFLLSMTSTFLYYPMLFFDWVARPIIYTGIALVDGAIFPNMGDGLEDLGDMFDLIIRQTFATATNVMNNESFWGGFWANIGAMILMAFMGITYLVFWVLLIVNIAAIWIFTIAGIIVVFFASFEKTRFVFWSWIRGLATFVLTPVFISFVMAFIIRALARAANQLHFVSEDASYGLFTTEYWTLLMMGGIGIFLMVKAAEMAAALTGGQPSSMQGFAASMSAAAGSSWYGLRGIQLRRNSGRGTQSGGNPTRQ